MVVPTTQSIASSWHATVTTDTATNATFNSVLQSGAATIFGMVING